MMEEDQAMKKNLLVTIFVLIVGVSSVNAAPIGVPGANTGAGQSTVGIELDFVVDRDVDGSPKDLEGMNFFVRGDIGVTKRIDLLVRLGFGRFESGGTDTDTGPAFGFGTKVTWAEIPTANLKIGSVVQMMQVRGDLRGTRASLTAYDVALGVFMDNPSTQGGALLSSYGGFVFSSADVEVLTPSATFKEDTSYGLFAGILMDLNQKTRAGIELRLVDQTALSLYTSFAF
jgi:hypothetical protein